MTKEKDIIKAVCRHYRIEESKLVKDHETKHPYGIARRMAIYLLYVNGIKVYTIAEKFGVSERYAFNVAAVIRVDAKENSYTRKELNEITEELNKQQ